MFDEKSFSIYWEKDSLSKLLMTEPLSSAPNASQPWENINTTPERKSLLADIIEASTKVSAGSSLDSSSHIPTLGTQPWVPKKPREPISMATFLKLIGSLLFVAIIFLGSFFAYIAFNPDQALFFVNTFNINPNDVQDLLKKLINGSFWFIMVILSIVWIISLFRAFWTPKELKRKRLLSWLTAGSIGIILFSILTFWAYLFSVVGATDYSNPGWSILIYDQDQYSRKQYRWWSRIYNTTNIIGPINIFFDIRPNALQIAKNNLLTIDEYNIDFDGANCGDGKSVMSWKDPANEQSLVCTFDQIKPYNIRGVYRWKNRLGEPKEIAINIPAIEIRGMVDIRNQTNNRWERIITLDATKLKKLGTPSWIYESLKEVTEPSITEPVSSIPQAICLKVFEKNGCDRVFILEDKNNLSIEGSINALQDPIENRLFHLSLSGISLNPNEILNIEWLLNNQSIICTQWSERCDYTFPSYGKVTINVTIEMANGKKYVFEKDLNITEPLKIVRHIKVTDKNGVLLNEENTYDKELKAYVLKNIVIPPGTLTFDARDVVSVNPGYSLDTVLWKISNGKMNEERRGTKIDIDFNQSLRYTVEGIYTFKKISNIGQSEWEVVQDTVIIDIERKSLMPRMDISMTSDYIPSLVTVDASQSESQNGEIKKFIFDFGEWKPPAEWDSIQQYEYTTSGDKTITLTIISQSGEKTSIKKSIVFKDQVKNINFLPSLTPWTSGSPIDFDASGTNGQIEDYIWNFGDNTPVAHGYNVSHTYTNPGTYNIILTVIYTDGTQRSIKKPYPVE